MWICNETKHGFWHYLERTSGGEYFEGVFFEKPTQTDEPDEDHFIGNRKNLTEITEEEMTKVRDFITLSNGNIANATTSRYPDGPHKTHGGEALTFAIDGKSVLEIHPDHFMIDGVRVNPREPGEAQRCIDIIVEALK